MAITPPLPSSPSPITFGYRLKRLRAQHDLTQEALAELAVCSVQTIRFFESGKRRPSVEMAERLAGVLDLPVQERGDFIRLARTVTPPLEEPVGVEAVPAGAPSVVRLPLPATELIGRQAEANALAALLIQERCRLVTLIGPGGMGKTRLALHAAHELAGQFAGGAVFVSLVAITAAAEMPSAIANGLNVPLAGESNLIAQLDALLAGRALLLVLDNFEHLLSSDGEDAVALIDHIVQHIPTVHLLITSRERLRVAGERVFELGGLAIPGAQTGDAAESDAVLLFLQRARQVSPTVALTPANRSALVQLCALLGGMPLGIELAAAWVRVLTPGEIVAEMTRSIDFLTLADRSAPLRHRSLRAVFEHSWKLLTPEERSVVARLAVFRDGFSREAAQAVAGAGLAQLAAFVDKSLVRTTTEAGPDSSLDTPRHLRYTMHELLRQFLHTQLQAQGEEQTANRCHAEYFTALAARVEPHLYADMTPAWLYQLESEQGNIRAALEWCIVQGSDSMLGLRLAGSMGPYWYLVGAWQEGRDWLHLALNQKAIGAGGREHAQALTKLGELLHSLADYTPARRYLEDALALWRSHDDEPREAWTLFQMGILASTIGELPKAEALLNQSLALYRKLDDAWGIATVLMQLTGIAMLYNDYGRAAQLLDEAVPILRRHRYEASMGVALNLLGWTQLAQGNFAAANANFHEAGAMGRRHANLPLVGWSLRNLGIAHYRAGSMEEAAGYLRACLRIYQQIGYKSGALVAFEALAAVYAEQGCAGEAVRWLAVACQLRTTTGQPRTGTDEELDYQRTVQITQTALGADGWQAAWQAGAHLSLEEAYALALAA